MFGITKLTPEEKTEHTRIKRVAELISLINKEGLVRSESLAKAEAYTQELDVISFKPI
jgi:hypothetical protein|tara:strand:- start:149 stop:322 length:174 start_codon:yes stop_codon:yes gene_type:complete